MTTELVLMEVKEQTQVAVPRPRAEANRGLPMAWLLPGMLSAGLLWMAFFPLSWGVLAWVALVPLLTLVRLEAPPWRIYIGAYLSGLVFFAVSLQWMRVADYRMYYTWAMLATYCAVYFPAAIYLLRLLDKLTALPLVLTVPVVWTSLEFIRSFAMTGFAWYFLGHSQHTFLTLIQIADVTGVYGVSLLLAAVNGWLMDCLWRFEAIRRLITSTRRRAPRPAWLAWQGIGLAAVVAACCVYGDQQLQHTDFEVGPRLALLQGNVDQRIRNLGLDNDKMLNDYRDMAKHAGRPPVAVPGMMAQSQTPDLIVWPETSFPYYYTKLPPDPSKATEADRKRSAILNDMFHALVRNEARANQLFGLNSVILNDHRGHKKYNSALLWPLDNSAVFDRYDRIHRVPFGEYVPLRDSLPFMNYFAPYDTDYSISIGEKMTRFVLGKYRFGVLICNEDADPVLARAYGAEDSDGPKVDFLVNISNDSWFDDTTEHEEHLAICRFRAIETRRAMARAVNTGISAVIDSNGRVLKPKLLANDPEFFNATAAGQDLSCRFWQIDLNGPVAELPVAEWAQYKKVAGVLIATVPIDDRSSLYVQWGDWLPRCCCLVLLLAVAWGMWRRPTPVQAHG